jgi:hypothetical protein
VEGLGLQKACGSDNLDQRFDLSRYSCCGLPPRATSRSGWVDSSGMFVALLASYWCIMHSPGDVCFRLFHHPVVRVSGFCWYEPVFRVLEHIWRVCGGI